MHLVYTVLVFVLTSCIRMPDYPTEWEPVETTNSLNQCPQLAGLFTEWGDAPNGCHAYMEACRSLTTNLLTESIGYKEHHDRSSKPKFPIGTHVELRQPADNELEIIQWQLGNHQKWIVSRKTLTMENGDFTCSADGLTLKTRPVYFVIGLVNDLGSVKMILNTSEDGDLVIKSIEDGIINDFFTGGPYRFEKWFRWQAVDNGRRH